jgi:hypothetical protein
MLIVILFGVIAAATSILTGWTLYRSLTSEYRSKGIAIAQGIADSSAEILLNRDLATVQSTIDEFTEIAGVGYVFVTDSQGEIVSHTFVPAVPNEMFPIIRQSRASWSSGDAVTTTLEIQGIGKVHSYLRADSSPEQRDLYMSAWIKVSSKQRSGPRSLGNKFSFSRSSS